MFSTVENAHQSMEHVTFNSFNRGTVIFRRSDYERLDSRHAYTKPILGPQVRQAVLLNIRALPVRHERVPSQWISA